MADNPTIDNGALTDYVVGGAEIGLGQPGEFALEIGERGTGVLLQRMKLDVGADNASDPVVQDISGKVPVTAQGTLAHDVADAGNPVKIGGRAPVASESTPALVAANDRADAWFERDGSLVTSNREWPRQEATWTSATGINTVLELDVNRAGSAILWMRPSGTITAGHLTFECTINGGTSWVALSGSNADRPDAGPGRSSPASRGNM